MDYQEQEKNSHTLFDERSQSDEINDTHGESLPQCDEVFISKELGKVDEVPDQGKENNSPKKKGKDKGDSDRIKELTKWLSMTAVVVTAGTALVIPILSLPQLEGKEEYVGFDCYECVFYTDEELELTATVKDEKGEQFTTVVAQDGEAYYLYLDELSPDTGYQLTVVDEKGKKRYSDEFITDPFIKIEEIDQTKLAFALHEDISLDTDFRLMFLSSDGRDFESNMVWDNPYDITANFIYLDGLYKDEYVVRFERFLPEQDQPIVYEKNISLGTLNKLEYTAAVSIADGVLDATSNINLMYVSGDVAPYSPIEIRLTNKSTGQEYYMSDVLMPTDSLDLTVTPTEQIEAGDYTITLYGFYESEEFSLYNEIWQGELIVGETVLPTV